MTMSLSEQQVQLKEQGNAALAAGDAARALALYSEALDAPGGTDAGRAILYSNRAAACMLIKDHTSALEDADACVRLDSTFAKGFVRKGAALYALGRTKEAAEAYRQAATKATTPEQTADYNKLADKYEEETRTGRRPSAMPTGASSFTPMSPVVLALRVMSILLILGWIATFDRQFYVISMLLLGASSLITIFQREGRPRMSVEYAERLLSDNVKPYFLLPLVYASMVPLFPAVTNSQLIAIGPLARNLHSVLARIAPGPAERVGSTFKESNRLATLLSIPEWVSLSTDQRFARFDEKMEAACSRFEVAAMVVLLLMMLTPSGNFVSVLVYAQVLKLRYLTYEPVKRTIHDLDNKVATYARRTPYTEKAYQTVRRGVAWFGMQGVQNAQARRTQMPQMPQMPSCVVM